MIRAPLAYGSDIRGLPLAMAPREGRDTLCLHKVTGIVISGIAYYNGAIGFRPLRRLQGEAYA